MNTGRWFFRVFQSAPDLICSLRAAATGSAPPQLSPNKPVDQLYRFSAPELKALSHRLDGVLWPRQRDTGTPDHPVVILEERSRLAPPPSR